MYLAVPCPKVYRRGNAFWPTFVIGGADSSGPKGVAPRYFRKNDSYYQLLNGTILDLVYNTYRRAQPFNLPAQPFNLSISDKLWTLEKNKGHFIILELNSGIIKWPYFLPKVFSL